MGKIFITILLTVLVCFGIFTWIINGHTSTVIKSWEQPETVTYKKGRYHLSYMKAHNESLDKFQLDFLKTAGNDEKHFFIVSKNVTKAQLHFINGHYKLYSLNEYNKYRADGDSFDLLSYLEKCEVVWDLEGVTITEPSGHKLFIPKESF